MTARNPRLPNGRVLLLALVLSAVRAPAAHAQVVSLGASAAPVFQVGDFGDNRSLATGWHVGVNARLDTRHKRLGLQADLGVASSPYVEGTFSGHAESWDGGLAVFYRLKPITTWMRPYLLGGIGVYYVEEPDRNTIVPALNGGAGVESGTKAIRAFIEARYHQAFTAGDDLRYIPLSLGLRYAFNP